MKRDIDLLKVRKTMEVQSQYAVNKGLPFNSKSLHGLEAKDRRIYENIRQGTANVRIFRDE